MNASSTPLRTIVRIGPELDGTELRDVSVVGSTYGPDGITAAVRIGFDDNRSLGRGQTGGRLALPVFQELMLGVYGAQLAGRVPAFPAGMEARISAALRPSSPLPQTEPPLGTVALGAVAFLP